jgi:hypothetical protein
VASKPRRGRVAAANRGGQAERPRSTSTGYGRPPEHGRFKPGTSGNPKGRPKNSRNLKTIIQQALTSLVTVREGSRTRTVSKLEGIVLRQVEAGLKGNEKAALAVLRMAGHVDLLSGSEASSDTTELTPAERRIFDGLMTTSAKALDNSTKRK